MRPGSSIGAVAISFSFHEPRLSTCKCKHMAILACGLQVTVVSGTHNPEDLMMAKLKLTYFDFDGGRGEPARLALHIGGIPFEDHRIAGKDWPTLRVKAAVFPI